MHSSKEVQAVFEVLQEVGQTLQESTLSEDDISKKLRIISQIIFRLDESQLREIWRKTFQPGNATVRLLFIMLPSAYLLFMVDLHTCLRFRPTGTYLSIAWPLVEVIRQ